MDWLALMASTARLLDLHDCDRAVGASTFTPPEQRPGAKTGLWLDVATQLLAYLHERDLENNEAWVPLGEIVEQLSERHGIAREDVLFVANYLATPTQLFGLRATSDGELHRHSLKRETALIEWPPNIRTHERCRLSGTGARTVHLSRAAEKWLYAADDASKLLKAVEYGAFADIPLLAEGLISQTRRFSKDISLLLERQHQEELMERFTARKDVYLKILQQVQEAVQAANDAFSLKATQEQFAQWEAGYQGGAPLTNYAVFQAFSDVLQAIERLNRKFQDMLSELASAKREGVGVIRFDEAAKALARHPCSDEITALCIQLLGPWSTAITAPSALDFQGILSLPRQEHSRTTLVFDEPPREAMPPPIEQFLAAHGARILAALKTGPVSLTEAIAKGWLRVGEHEMLAQLVGIYVAPDWLSDDDARELAVSIGPGALKVKLPDGAQLEGDELILHWLGASPAHARVPDGH